MTDHCLRSRNHVNVVVAGKQPAPQYLDHGSGGEALRRRHRHLALGQQRCGREPDVVMACAGDVPTLETLAAVDLLREHVPDLLVRVVNIVDLMALQRRISIRTGLARCDVRQPVHARTGR